MPPLQGGMLPLAGGNAATAEAPLLASLLLLLLERRAGGTAASAWLWLLRLLDREREGLKFQRSQ